MKGSLLIYYFYYSKEQQELVENIYARKTDLPTKTKIAMIVYYVHTEIIEIKLLAPIIPKKRRFLSF